MFDRRNPWCALNPDPSIWQASLVAASATAAALLLLLRQAHALPLDLPNERSLHTRPTPRIGGLALIPAATVAVMFGVISSAGGSSLLWGVLLLALLLFVLSAFDDRRGLSVRLRLAGHLLAAAWAAWLLTDHWLPALLVTLGLAWMTNLFNFMDGANGLAGGMSLFGFGALAWASSDSSLALLAASLAAAAAGFLFFNFDPARVFLGDAGSIPLGFLAGALGAWGMSRGDWPLWFPLLVFSPFIVDATVTLLRRGLRGERVWQAHREHYYQRLVRLGWSHRRLALAEYGLMAGGALWAMLLLGQPSGTQLIGVALWLGLLAALMAVIDRHWQRKAA